ncbi:phosphotransferase [Ascidiimonas sp. W6]|uniref:phosphotransferase n=1 Tax=Ascidiimonas meishanensis TaxID=3128903 RepID=UPI0030EEB350
MMQEIKTIPGRGLVSPVSLNLRLDYLKKLNFKTDKLVVSGLDLNDIQKNIESYIGSVEIPVGILGPLLFKEKDAEEFVYGAAATLEGALVMSMNRGARAISESDGFKASIAWQRMTRAPMFLFETKEEAGLFKKFTKRHFEDIKKVAEGYSNHAVLHEIKSIQKKKVVHLRFNYTTGDASGQNMTTTCTWHAMLHLVESFRKESGINPIDFVIEGNASSDKKVSLYTIASGRGIRVTASCVLKEEVIAQVLRTTSDKLVRCFKASRKLARQNGMIGYNINVANAISSIFAATGQDLACIHESSVGIFSLKKVKKGLAVKLTLPNLVIGTVGGGTHLPKQSQALELMGCMGPGKVERFAKLIAGFALGLEISTSAAIVSGEFAKAHEKLGRNKPKNWLLKSELNPKYLQKILVDSGLTDIELLQNKTIENGILTSITGKISKKLIGFVPLKAFRKADYQEVHVLLKSKPTDAEVIKGLHMMAASVNPLLSNLIKDTKEDLEYKKCHLKELEVYEFLNRKGFKNMPEFYGTYINKQREIYIIAQEFLEEDALSIYNSENHPEKWDKTSIENVIKTAAHFHQLTNQPEALQSMSSVQHFVPHKGTELYDALLRISLKETGDAYKVEQLKALKTEIRSDRFINQCELPKTIIHNDFNPRNIAVRKDGTIVIYDWELAVIDYPHRDIVEFLSFVLPKDFSKEELMYYLEYHFNLLPEEWKKSYSKAAWFEGYRQSLVNFMVSRAVFYDVAGILIKYKFSDRILHTAFRMLAFLEENE